MSGLLLDTNVIVWLLLGARDRVPQRVVALLQDRDVSVAVSAVSVWEIAVKRSLGKLDIDGRWLAVLGSLGFESLPVTALQAATVERLPWHHRDPFDRLLVAQAQVENRLLVSADGRMAAYDIQILWS